MEVEVRGHHWGARRHNSLLELCRLSGLVTKSLEQHLLHLMMLNLLAVFMEFGNSNSLVVSHQLMSGV